MIGRRHSGAHRRKDQKRRTAVRRTLAFGLACTLVTGLAWGYWSIGSVPGGNGQAQAAMVGQGSTPTTTAAGNAITITWAATTLTNGQAVDGYKVNRYSAGLHASQTILSACTGTVTALSCVESNVPDGDWVYTVTPVFATNWLGAESQDSDPVTSDGTAPVNDVSLAVVSGAAAKTGNTVYYRGTAAGSLRLSNAVVDLGSGPASSTTAALGGTSTGWTHTPSTVSTPAGGPFVSNPFSWGAGTTSAPTDVVTGKDGSGNTAQTTVSFVNDSTNPTGNIAYSNGVQSGRSVVVTFSAHDNGSGIASSQLQRASAPLTAGSCGSFTTFANLGSMNPNSPYKDTTVTNGNCYKYQYVVTDLVGNQLVATSGNAAKVGYAEAVAGTAGLLSHWRLGEGAASLVSKDSFTETAGTEVGNHVGETGASWTALGGMGPGAGKETIGADGRAYRDGDKLAIVHTNAAPASQNYSVEADLHQKTLLTNDAVAIIGRFTPKQGQTEEKYYAGGRSASGAWQIGEGYDKTVTPLATASTSALTVGQTYRVRLEMSGTTTTTLTLFVNGVQVLTVNDTTAPLTNAGNAGIMDGVNNGTANKTASVGLHVDNFQVKPSTYPRAADSKGSNTGDYMNDPTLGASGAFSDNTAARFDGVNEYMQAVATTGIPVGATSRSVEMWFKTSSSSKQVLFSYGSLAANQEFGLWLNSGGATMTAFGSGGGDKTFTLASAVNDGNWHQVVKTYDGTNITLYVDGAPLTAQPATRSTTMDPSGFVVGAILNSASGNFGNYFNGSLDEVSLYNTVLDQATVTNHWNLRDIVIPPNNPPTGTSATLTATEDTPRTLTTADFGYGDAAEEEPHPLLAVKVTTLPAAGTLKLDGVAVTAGQYVSAADIAAGLLVFQAAADANGTSYTSFTFQVQDNGGTASGGSDLDASPNTITYNVTAVNDTPSFTKGADQSVVQDTGAYSIPNWATNISTGPANESSQTLTFTVTTPGSPDLFSINPTISPTGTLTYTLEPGASGTTTITVKVQDNGGGGGLATSPNQTFVVTVIPTNRAPVNTVPGSQSTMVNTPEVFSSANGNALSVSDSDAGSSPIQLQVISTNGTSTLSTTSGLTFTAGANGTATMTFTGTQTAINTALSGLSFAPTTGYSGAASLRLVSNDLGNTGPGGAKSDDDTVAITVNTLTYGATVSATAGLVNYYRLAETSGTAIADSKGTNTGALFASPALNVAGAITGNAAINFDKATDYASVPRQVQDDLSLEFWFKSSAGIGTDTDWDEGAGLVNADATGGGPGGADDFGVALRSDGKVIAGTGEQVDHLLGRGLHRQPVAPRGVHPQEDDRLAGALRRRFCRGHRNRQQHCIADRQRGHPLRQDLQRYRPQLHRRPGRGRHLQHAADRDHRHQPLQRPLARGFASPGCGFETLASLAPQPPG